MYGLSWPINRANRTSYIHRSRQITCAVSPVASTYRGHPHRITIQSYEVITSGHYHRSKAIRRTSRRRLDQTAFDDRYVQRSFRHRPSCFPNHCRGHGRDGMGVDRCRDRVDRGSHREDCDLIGVEGSYPHTGCAALR